MNAMIAEKLKQNWFWSVAILLWAAVWLLVRQMPQDIPANYEYAVLTDVFITMPLLLWLCYRSQLTTKALLLRVVGVVSLGIWLASQMLQPEHQTILPLLGSLRNIGLGVAIAIELWLFVSILKIVFKKETTSQVLVDQGIPEYMAKLMLLEARFWRWVFGLFKK
jgi:hypothetical protein